MNIITFEEKIQKFMIHVMKFDYIFYELYAIYLYASKLLYFKANSSKFISLSFQKLKIFY